MPVSRKSEERRRLSCPINAIGIMVLPCENCKKGGLECRKSDHSSRCGNCVRRGLSCGRESSGPSASDMDKIVRERDRLIAERNAAEEAISLASESMSLAFAKRKRVERLQEFLEKRAGEMIRRGVENIESLEKLEEEERLEKERADASTVATSEPTGASSSSTSCDWLPSPSLLRDLDVAQWGFVDETPEPSAGTS